MSNDILVKIGADVTQFSKAMADSQKSLNNFSKANKETFDAFKKVGAVVTGAGIAIATGLGASVMMASDFQSAFAGVRKTVDTSEAGFAVLEKGIRDMAKELPATASEIAAVAESAGQLGIEEKNILEFTRTMIDLGEATNLTAEEAANSFARFANITKMPQTEFDNLGSVVVELGNNMATTESEIVAMSMRLAAQGRQVGMTEAEIMALAGTMSSLGIEAEAGGSAMTSVLTKIQKAVGKGKLDLEVFAKAAHMSSKEFAESFKEDPIKALELLARGLGDSADAGENMTEILEDLGIKGIREADVMKRLAGNSELLGEAVRTANGAWDENTALTKEATQRYETFESKLAILGNKFKDVGIMIGNVMLPVMEKLVVAIGRVVDWFSKLSPKAIEVGVIMAAVTAALAFIIGPMLLLVGFLPAIIGGFTALSTVLAAITAPIGLVVAAIAAAIAIAVLWYNSFDKIEKKLGTTATVILGVISPINRIATIMKLVKRGFEDAIDPVDRFGEGVTEATQEAVGGFMDLSEKADVALKEVVWSQKEMTKELATDMISGQQEITDSLLQAIGDRHTQEKAATKEQFAQIESLTDEQKAKIIKGTEQHYAQESIAVESGNAVISGIIQKASDENRAITQDESDMILGIREGMTVQAVAVMSESAEEQKLIYERMKDNASTISALEAAEVVKNSVKKKDDVVTEAENQYTETRLWAEQQRDELGTLSAEEAQDVINEAERKKNDSVSAAEEMHNKVIDEAKAQAGEHVNEVDWSTGEIKSKWDILKEDLMGVMKAIGEFGSRMWDGTKENWNLTVEFLKGIWSAVSSFFSELWKGIVSDAILIWDTLSLAWELAVENVKELWSSITEFFSILWGIISTNASEAWTAITEEIMSVVTPLVEGVVEWFTILKDGVTTVVDGLKQYFEGVWELIKNIFLGALILIYDIVTGNFENLKTDAIEIMENIKVAFTNIWEGIKTMFGGVVDTIVAHGMAAWSKLSENVSTSLNQVKTFFSTIWNSIKAAYSATVTAIVNAGKTAWANLKTATSAAMNSIKTLFNTIWTGIKTFFTTTLGELVATARSKFTEVKNAIKDKLTEAVRVVSEKIGEMPGKVIAKIGEMKTAGVNLIKGLISGISSMGQGAIDAITGVVGGLVNKAKSLLKIQSPSRVFMAIGGHVGGGLAKGISKSTSKVTKSITAQAVALKKSANEALKNAEMKFDTKKMGVTKYISELKRIQKQYKLTGEQNRKVQKELFQAGSIQTKQASNLKNSISKVNDGVKAADNKLLNKVNAINVKLKKDIVGVNNSFKKELSGLANSIYNQVGLFSEVKSSKVDGGDLLKNLKAQNSQAKAFKSNLASIQSSGVSKAFVDELKSMGVGAADEIKAIAAMPKALLKEYVNAWSTKHKLANSEAAIQMAQAKKDTVKQVRALNTAAKAELSKTKTAWVEQLRKLSAETAKMGDFKNSGKVLGANTVAGLIKGLRSMNGPLEAAAKSLAMSVTSTVKKALRIKSPSRVFMELGRFTGEGLAVGMYNATDLVAKAAQGMADAAVVEPDLSYATPDANYGSLSAALSGEVNVNQRDSALIGAIASLESKLTNLRVEMDGQKVGSIVTPHVNGTNAVNDVTRYF